MNDSENKKFLAKVVAKAQKESKDWSIGHIVVHPSEPTAAKLLAIDEGVATLFFVDGRRLKFPIAEVFDPNRAMKIAREMQAEYLGMIVDFGRN